MRPMLDDLELPQVQEILTHDRRTLAEHKPPGMAGSLLQNMGRRPTGLMLWGVAAGPDAVAFVEKLDEKFREAQPLPFAADIVTEAEIEQMLIDDVQWQELAGKPDRFAYVLKLVEYIEPKKPPRAQPGFPDVLEELDADILNDALEAINGALDSLDLIDQLKALLEQLRRNQALLAGRSLSDNLLSISQQKGGT